MEKVMNLLVDKILRGQANADRMKREIKWTINTVVSSLYDFELRGIKAPIVMVHEDYPGMQWEFNPKSSLKVSLWENTIRAGIPTRQFVYSSDCDAHFSEVQKVRDSLEMFVHMMVVKFPELEKRLITPMSNLAGPDPVPVAA